jgi:hypothetical protein
LSVLSNIIVVILLYYIDFSNLSSIEHRFIQLIKWKDENGLKKELRIYSEIAHKWKEIASLLLGLKQGQILTIENDHRQAYSCITVVLGRWFENATHLPSARVYPKSWQGLIKLLNDVQLGEVSKELERTLSSQTNSVRDNYS